MRDKEMLAALDLGTNTVLLLTATVGDDGVLREHSEFYGVTRLGQDLERTGRLDDGAVERTLVAAGSFVAGAREQAPAGRGIAAATSAVRDAVNREAFLQRCTERLGAAPLVLSGADEAATVFRGVTSDQPAAQFLVTADIGGGSTEVSAGFPGRCLYSVSLALGCVRYGERFGLFETPAAEALDKARAAMAELLAPVGTQIARLRPANTPPNLIVSGGTATTYAAVELALSKYDRNVVHGHRSSTQALREHTVRLFGMPLGRRAQVPGIEPGRAPVLPTGMLILGEILRALEASEFSVSTRGLRFGLLLRLLAGEIEPTWTW